MIKRIIKFIKGDAGVIAVMFAMAVPALVAAIGLSVDLGKAYLVRDRLGHALDAAGLAVANSTESPGDIQTRLEQFMEANYPEEKIGETYDITFEKKEKTMRVSAKALVDTSFMALLGLSEVDVAASSIIRRSVNGIETSLVLDVTGSMAGGKMNSLRSAATSFVDILFDRADEPERVKISLVPYSSTVNVGDLGPQYIYNPYDPSWDPQDDYAPYDPSDSSAWKGCVMARSYPYDTTDDHPGVSERWEIYRWQDSIDNNWYDNGDGGVIYDDWTRGNNNTGPNLACPNPITPLTSDEILLKDQISDLNHWSRGGTLGNLGMVWGWRSISPKGPFKEGESYSEERWRKVIIMMTDGDNLLFDYDPTGTGEGDKSDFSAYRRLDDMVLGTSNANIARDEVNLRLSETCEGAKSKGITIYTIIFGSVSGGTEDIYRQCASDSNKYYEAPSASELVDVYDKIAQELVNLHISYE